MKITLEISCHAMLSVGRRNLISIPDLHQCNSADCVKTYRSILSYDEFQVLLMTEHFH